MRKYISREEAIRALLNGKMISSDIWWWYISKDGDRIKQSPTMPPHSNCEYHTLERWINAILNSENLYIYEKPKEKPKLEWSGDVLPWQKDSEYILDTKKFYRILIYTNGYTLALCDTQENDTLFIHHYIKPYDLEKVKRNAQLHYEEYFCEDKQ